MSKLFSLASWNVEHFKNEPHRVQRIVDFLSGKTNGPAKMPDVFALFEVEGKDIYHAFMSAFPQYRFHLTEGVQTQEIFVAVHQRLQSFTTQRLEFKTQRAYQRPGLLLTIRLGNRDYPILFLHIRSGSGTEDFGLRDAALEHAFNLKKALDRASGGQANFIFLGDLNTMGIDDPVPYSKRLDLPPEEEIARIAHWANKRNMKLMPKETTVIDGAEKVVTWYNGSSAYEPADLDHVVASAHMDIRGQGSANNLISVLGWPKLPPADWPEWLANYSDHAMLYFEVWEKAETGSAAGAKD